MLSENSHTVCSTYYILPKYKETRRRLYYYYYYYYFAVASKSVWTIKSHLEKKTMNFMNN